MKPILFQLQAGEESYLPVLKPLVQGRCQLFLNNQPITAILEVALRAKEKGAVSVVVTNEKLLHLLAPGKEVTLDKYQGSMFERYGVEFLILPPLEHLVKVPYAKFIYERQFKKFLDKDFWLQVPDFKWELFQPQRADTLLNLFQTSTFISVDIETERSDARIITCIGFTAISISPISKSFTATTVVIPFTELFNIAFARTILGLHQPKVFQNGKYDNAYLLRYNCPTTNYAFDTINLFHSWYCELPKDLGFITGFMLRKWEHHKGESSTTDLMQYYQYNAKDAFVTAMTFLALLTELPPWALSNFLQEMPVVWPCILTEAQGLKVDIARMGELRKLVETNMEVELGKLRKMVANAGYNPSSSQQTQRLFKLLGSQDVTSTTPPQMDKVANRHPLNKVILSSITTYRKNRKLETGYVQEDKLWLGRIFYTLNPHGTDTGRLASKEGQFWSGLQLQNIPTGKIKIKIKSMFISNSGFYFGEADYKQAETYDTAYLSGDPTLLEAIHDNSKDFHGRNASMFFGVPYEKIMNSFQDAEGVWQHEKLDKVLRDDIGKRINHGANYNMGPKVLLDTMGIANVLAAKHALKLPYGWSLLKVCEHLLGLFAKTYPTIKGPWYEAKVKEVTSTSFLVGPTGYHRFCFGKPDKNKRDLNRYVAHPPQHLNAMTLNRAYRNVFYKVWLPNQLDFRLGPQIHDSILFQYRKGRVDLCKQVKECMEFPVPVTDIFGTQRQLTVPVDLKGESEIWSEMKELKI